MTPRRLAALRALLLALSVVLGFLLGSVTLGHLLTLTLGPR